MILPNASINKARAHFGLSKQEAEALNEDGSIEWGTKAFLTIFPVLKANQNPDLPNVQYDESMMEVRLTYVGVNYMTYGAPPRQSETVEAIRVPAAPANKAPERTTKRWYPGDDWAHAKTRPMKGDPRP